MHPSPADDAGEGRDVAGGGGCRVRIDDRNLDGKTTEVIFGLIHRPYRTQRPTSGIADCAIHEDRMRVERPERPYRKRYELNWGPESASLT
jgi:hypothetical protein